MNREKIINGLEWILNDMEENGHGQIDYYADEIREAITLLKEQGVKEQISDAIHETAKQFRRQIVMCKDCRFKECEGRNGLIVCDITGESHGRLWFCADGERRDG